jgi:hypothetical protein
MSIKNKVPPTDFRLEDHGSLYLFCPQTEAARCWLEDHCLADGEHQYLGPNLAVEARYAAGLWTLAVDAGLTLSR